MNVCTKCAETKPEEAFALRYDREPGCRRRDCKDCEAKRRRDRLESTAQHAPVRRFRAVEARTVVVDDSAAQAAFRAWRGPVTHGALRWAA